MVTDDICMRWISLEKSRENEILKILSVALRRIFSSEIYDYNKLQEIRLRMNEPLIVIYDNREYFVTEKGKRTTECKKAYMVAPADIRETLEYISNYSLYAYEDEIRQGFITIQGGHRVGLAGKVILESGMIKSVRHISFINIRLRDTFQLDSKVTITFDESYTVTAVKVDVVSTTSGSTTDTTMDAANLRQEIAKEYKISEDRIEIFVNGYQTK